MAGLVQGFEFIVSNVKDVLIFKCSSGFMRVSFEEHALPACPLCQLPVAPSCDGHWLVRDPLTRSGPEGRGRARLLDGQTRALWGVRVQLLCPRLLG